MIIKKIAVTTAITAALAIASAAPAIADPDDTFGPAALAATAQAVDGSRADLANAVAPRSAALPEGTASQQNAVRKAQQYLNYTAFSRKSLIEQLEYEGFSTEDSTFAVDSLNVDWNQQAVKKARQYLNYTAFSRQGLIEQLEYEGFTPSQAAYGVAAAYQ
ncbi:MAG: Ltp family lipoprotein [Mycobacterium sp.]|uniref:Ltp family lipoprotein n=1 Tax=Mycobacterium sp. TaxID=1785 RepID=UPI003F9A2D5A